CGVSRRCRTPARALGGVPSPALHRRLEREREKLGLPVPRVAVRAGWHGIERAGAWSSRGKAETLRKKCNAQRPRGEGGQALKSEATRRRCARQIPCAGN